MNPASFEDFEALSRELASLPRGCFYLWPMQMDASSSAPAWEAVCFGALAALARWYAGENSGSEFRLVAVAGGLADPFGAPPIPETSLLRGPLAALANEFFLYPPCNAGAQGTVRAVASVATSPDGSIVAAVAADDAVSGWRAATGERLAAGVPGRGLYLKE